LTDASVHPSWAECSNGGGDVLPETGTAIESSSELKKEFVKKAPKL
jgi:hypothetical protein